MFAVRRVLGTAGLAGLLALSSLGAGPVFADPTPSPDPSASADPSPAPSTRPSTNPSTTTDCGQVQGSGDITPALDPGVVCQAGGVNPGAAPSGEPETTTDCDPLADGSGTASPPPSGVVCIASGVAPGAGTGTGATRLPRTGPAPLLPTLTIGCWLLLLGVLAALAGRRRTAGPRPADLPLASYGTRGGLAPVIGRKPGG